MEKTSAHRGCMGITAAQLRAARALLGWNQQQLADASLVGVATIRRFEAAMSQAMGALQERGIRRTLEDAGVIFIESNGQGPGVRLKKTEPTNASDGTP